MTNKPPTGQQMRFPPDVTETGSRAVELAGQRLTQYWFVVDVQDAQMLAHGLIPEGVRRQVLGLLKREGWGSQEAYVARLEESEVITEPTDRGGLVRGVDAPE